MNKILVVFLISCLCLYEIHINSRMDPEIRFQLAPGTDFYLQRHGRRLLSKPGSFPPRCASKCGRCMPCKAAHVPVPPGTPIPEEYYPEAWRCKCGNNLYMP